MKKSKKQEHLSGTNREIFIRSTRLVHPMVVLPTPNSWVGLPKPLLPTRQDFSEVSSIEQSIIRTSGWKPQVYTDWDSIRNILFPVHDRLIQEVEDRIKPLNLAMLTNRLYDQLEICYGLNEYQKSHLTAAVLLTGDQQFGATVNQMLQDNSPHTLGLRYLLEMVVKHCNIELSAAVPDFTIIRLIALATRIVDMDGFLDHAYFGILPQELLITKDHKAVLRPSQVALEVTHKWQKARTLKTFDYLWDMGEGLQEIVAKPIQLKTFTDTEPFLVFNDPMKEEFGYSLTEWMEFVASIIQCFNDYERLKNITRSDLIQFIRQNSKINDVTLDHLLDRFTLSSTNMDHLKLDDMLPMGKFWRDFRVLNRPIIQLDNSPNPKLAIGLETFSGSAKLFFYLLSNGLAKLLGAKSRGPVDKATGHLDEHAGDVFRDELAANVHRSGFDAEKEVKLSSQKRKQEIGPIDIVVIDKQTPRLILVEAKDVNTRTTPREWRDQMTQFIGKHRNDSKSYCYKLMRKRDLLKSQLPTLTTKYEIPDSSTVIVECVIVVSHPLLWMYTSHGSPVPILDENEFLRTLTTRNRF